MHIQLFAPALAGVLLLSACSNMAEQRAQRVAAIPEEKRAYIIGAYAVGCEPAKDRCRQAFNAISTHYRNVEDKDFDSEFEFVHGSVFGKDTVPDYTRMDRQDKGIYFCVPLPAGRYSVYAYDFYNFAGGGSGYSMKKEHHFDLPFSVSEGEVAYLGTLKISAATGKNIFGMPLPAPGVLLLSSSPGDAMDKALQKCPEHVRTRPVRNAALRAEGASPYVLADPQP
ncbi:hypothetical protein [Massilia sp. SYSU DXS3249]